ncbi:MAG: hypothetical protein QOF44_5811, partial [Streptomyces sp.]|nr:hypothetical protein [Streptomyces sp.]
TSDPHNLGKVTKRGQQALHTPRKGEVGTAMPTQPGCQQTGSASASASS